MTHSEERKFKLYGFDQIGLNGPPEFMDLHDPEFVERLVRTALDLTTPARPHCASRNCRLRKPVYWVGRQWAVTGRGVESYEYDYPIERDRLWEDEDHGHGWITHMAEKEWVDLPDFCEALRVARMRWPRRI
jgi:hypothetical protein